MAERRVDATRKKKKRPCGASADCFSIADGRHPAKKSSSLGDDSPRDDDDSPQINGCCHNYRDFSTKRWFIRPALVDNEGLALLRREADVLLAHAGAAFGLAANGCALDPMEDVIGVLPPNHAVRSCPAEYMRQRYRNPGPLASVVSARPTHSDAFRELLAETIAPLAQLALGETLGGGPYLFNEHFVVKPERSHIAFKWHTDENEQLAGTSESVRPEYVSVWIALDDAGPGNGGLVLGGVGEEGSMEEKKVPLSVAAGDAVVFSSKLWHCSGPNTSKRSRRVFYAQFSALPILGKQSPFPLCFSVPL